MDVVGSKVKQWWFKCELGLLWDVKERCWFILCEADVVAGWQTRDQKGGGNEDQLSTYEPEVRTESAKSDLNYAEGAGQK